jgi:hypothetical protein
MEEIQKTIKDIRIRQQAQNLAIEAIKAVLEQHDQPKHFTQNDILAILRDKDRNGDKPLVTKFDEDKYGIITSDLNDDEVTSLERLGLKISNVSYFDGKIAVGLVHIK